MSRRLFLASAASVSVAGTGCIHADGPSPDERGPGEVEEDGPDAPDELPYSTFDVIHAEDGGLVAFEMVDHWHFQPIEVEAGAELPVWFRVDLSGVDDATVEELDGSQDVELEVVSGDSSVVSVEERGGSPEGLVIQGEEAGEVEVVFAVVDGSGDVVYRTGPVPLHVESG